MELSKDTVKKIMWLITFTVLLAVMLVKFDVVIDVLGFLFGIIVPFLIGIMIAFALNLPMKFFERHLFSDKLKEKSRFIRKTARPFSLILALVVVAGVLTLVVFVVVPELGRTIMNLGPTIQNFMPTLEKWILNLFPGNATLEEWFGKLDFDWNSIINNMIDFLKNGAGDVISSTFSFAMGVITKITNFVIGFVFALYVLLQKEKLRVQLEKVMQAFLPEKVIDKIQSVSTLTYKTFASFVNGQCFEAVILGTMFFITLTIARFPYALLIGVLIAFTALIPIFGAFIGCFIGAFLILMISPVKALVFVIIFLVLQQIEGNLIYPHVVGGSVGLPSIWVLVAVSLGGSLMGVVGMIIFIPIVSIAYSLFRGMVNERLKKKAQTALPEETEE